MRIVSGILFVLMLLFTGVQYNDPDAMHWIAIYGVVALWCGVLTFRPAVFAESLWNWLLIATLAAALFGVVWYWPHTPHFWEKDVWWITETAREGMGMMIAFVALVVVWFGSRRFAAAAN